MSMIDLVAISVETSMIDCGSSLEKEFTKLIHMNLVEWYYTQLSIKLILVTVVYVVLQLETPKTPRG